MRKKLLTAFSLIEVSIVILIIGLLITAITHGSKMVNKAKLNSARLATTSLGIDKIPNMTFWVETTLEGSLTSVTKGTQPENGDYISNWQDLNPSSIKHNLSQANSANQATYAANAINGLPALKFDGTNDLFTISDLKMIGQTNSYTIFFVATTPPAFTTGINYNIFRSELGITAGLASNGSGTGFSCGRLVGTNGPWVGEWVPPGAPNIATSKPTICSSTYNGASLTGYTNGVADTPHAVSGNLSTPTAIAIGSNTANGALFNNYLGEIIIYDRALKLDERKAVEGYLSKKWQITAS